MFLLAPLLKTQISEGSVHRHLMFLFTATYEGFWPEGVVINLVSIEVQKREETCQGPLTCKKETVRAGQLPLRSLLLIWSRHPHSGKADHVAWGFGSCLIGPQALPQLGWGQG